MRVLHVTGGLAIESGGPPRVVASLMAPLSRLGVECTVFSPASRSDAGELVWPEAADVKLFPRGRLARWWPGHSPQMARELRETVHGFDVVHIHELWHHPHYAAAAAARRARVPYIVSPHGELEPWALSHRGLKKGIYLNLVQRRVFAGASLVHALTTTEEEQVRSIGVDRRVAVVPNGIDIAPYARLNGGEEFRRAYGIPQDARVALFLGRLHRKKGLDILAEAFGEMVAHRRSSLAGPFLVIAGPDEEGLTDGMQTTLRRHGALDRVRFTGMLTGDDRLAALAAADVFVLPSYSEGFSVAVLEALAAGRPVVITHNCNFPQVAACGAGFVVDPEVGQVSDALASILDQPELASQMGARARALVEESYGWDRVAGLFAEMYRSVLGGAEA